MIIEQYHDMMIGTLALVAFGTLRTNLLNFICRDIKQFCVKFWWTNVTVH